MFFKDCVTKLSILDITEGPGDCRHPIVHLSSVLTPRGFVGTLFAFLSAPGEVGSVWFCASWVRSVCSESAHSRCRWSPGGGAPAALPFEDNGAGWTGPWDTHFCVVPSCVYVCVGCVFLKRRNHKTPLAICQFQKMDSWETGLIGFIAWAMCQKHPGLIRTLKDGT